MSKLPKLTGAELARIVVKLGFVPVRQHGSHVFYKHADGRTVTIPVHSGEQLDRGLLNKITKHDLRLTREQFLELLR